MIRASLPSLARILTYGDTSRRQNRSSVLIYRTTVNVHLVAKSLLLGHSKYPPDPPMYPMSRVEEHFTVQ